jgi:hypothetical protein
MREMEFKMERSGLVDIGQQVEIREGRLPYSYYYVVEPAVAMSGNYPFRERLEARVGTVKEILEKDTGTYLNVEFAEEC